MIDHRRLGIAEDGQTTGGNAMIPVTTYLQAVRPAMVHCLRHGAEYFPLRFIVGDDYCAHNYSLAAKAFIASTAPMRASEAPSSR
ncbi:hypothetical protein BMS3Bbin14_00073 [bacterium BMS3Bbin14]|nr:hypothetical protein BMS3Bbin14_00073 [bacterium BMS3Bbin14]